MITIAWRFLQCNLSGHIDQISPSCSRVRVASNLLLQAGTVNISKCTQQSPTVLQSRSTKLSLETHTYYRETTFQSLH